MAKMERDAKTGETKPKRIGIFGGSFDPVHSGHAMIANYIGQAGIVDEVWLMPSPHNPLKKGNAPKADYENRLAMCRLVCKYCTNVYASEFESHLPSPHYTYNTLCELQKEYPQYKFYLIIGSDNWQIFDKWKNSREIIDEFGIIIYERPGYSVQKPNEENVVILKDTPVAEISSTFVREWIKCGKNPCYMIPPQVYDYIKKQELYG